MADDGNIGDALLKVALGCRVEEVTEEFSEVDGKLKLTKRKKTKKDIPPDLKAVQMLLSKECGGEYAAMSDEQLEEEKQRLLASLKGEKGTKKSERVEKSVTISADNKKKNETAGEKRKRPKPLKRVNRKKKEEDKG